MKATRGCLSLVGGLVLLIVIIAAAVGGSKGSKPTSTTGAAITTESTTSDTDRSTGTVPTTIDTPAPSAAPTPPPTTAPPTPPPAPVVLSGRNDDVVKVPAALGNDLKIVVATCRCSGNFIVTGLDSSNQETAIVVNEVGNVTATRLYNTEGQTGAVNLKVEADGPWTLTFKDPSAARTFVSTISGHGDDVVEYTGSVGIATFSNTGASGNFIIVEYSPDGGENNVDVNEIGNWRGKDPISGGPVYLDIESDGSWSVNAG